MRVAVVALVWGATLLGCPRRVPLGAPPRCTPGPRPAPNALALAAIDDGWAAVIPEGRSLYYRRFNHEAEPTGDRVFLWHTLASPDSVALARWPGGAVIVEAASTEGPAQVQRVIGTTAYDPFAITAIVTGPVSVTTDENRGVAVLTTGDVTTLVALDGEGIPGTPVRCDRALIARSAALVDETLYALSLTESSGGMSLQLLQLNDRCRVQRSLRLAEGNFDPRSLSLAADARGAWVAWSDDVGRSFVTEVSEDGQVVLRPQVLDVHAESPTLLLGRASGGDRRPLRVAAIQRTEVDARGILYDLNARGNVRDTTGLDRAPAMTWRSVAVNPWGGALLLWTRPDPTLGATMHRGVGFTSMTRVCP